MKSWRFGLLSFAFAALASFTVLVNGCDSLPIDPYVTFNITRSVDFIVPASSILVQELSISAIAPIDTTHDYETEHHSEAGLLKTSRVTRLYLHSSDPVFSLDHLIYARVLIGRDTVAMDSIPQFTGDTFLLTPTNVDVTADLKDTSLTATLQYKLRSAVATPVTITAGMTIVHTALPQP